VASVLITGGAGFIGTRLSAALLADGYRVDVLDSLHSQVHPDGEWPSDLPAGVARHRVDVTDPDGVDRVLRAVRPQVVLHLAAETGTGQSLTEASRHGLVNVVGTTNLLDAMTRTGHVAEHLLLASSRAVYGEGRWREEGGHPFYAPVRDADQLADGRWEPIGPSGAGAPVFPEPQLAGVVEPRPASVYAATKLAQEHLLRAWTSAMGVRLSTLRLQNVYGAGQSLANPYTGVLTVFAQQALRGRALDVFEDGRITRDFVHVSDVVAAFRQAVLRDGNAPLLVDIGSGEPATLLDVARLIAELAGAPAPVVSGRYRNGDVRAAWTDVAPAREALDWSPMTPLRTGVTELIAWVRGTRAGHVPTGV
jgi:dTDP-L-rhamnose 4-epimerase